MLSSLSIENYALIEELNIEFSKGFSVITGETGAGKSIILGALSLILGQRADTKALKTPSRKCVIEGSFDIRQYNLNAFFEQNDLDYEDQTILRREIAVSGKSRAFINDTPVNLPTLKELGERLVNVHSQHATITLNDANFQLALVDSYIGHDDAIKSYQSKYKVYLGLKSELKSFIETENQIKSDEDYFQFQFDELDKANLVFEEQEDLEKELEILNHSEEIKSTLFESNQLLVDSENNLIDKLSDIQQNLNKIASYHDEIQQISERLNANIIDIKDFSQDMGRLESTIDFDANQISQISERLDLIYHLQQKHRVQSIGELIEVKKQLETKLLSITSLETKIENLKKQIELIESELIQEATIISKARNAIFAKIETDITNSLKLLGMPEARFKIDNDIQDQLSKDGYDKVRFIFNANRGGELQEISKIASGGELSRLMLCLKSLVSEKKLLPTIIFDEIDNGVSGEIADKVGNILRKMADSMQVIAITHLPQIAGKGLTHFKVFKETLNETTESRITAISQEDRIIEIAKMISGSEVSEVALENAKILLS